MVLYSAGAPSPSAVEISQAPVSENPAVTIAAAIETSLNSGTAVSQTKNITVNVPSGATITRVIALARINIMNSSTGPAIPQTIDLRFNVEGANLFNQTDIVGFGAVTGASANYVIAENLAPLPANGQAVGLEVWATLSVPGSVRFQVQYYLFITYKMG